MIVTFDDITDSAGVVRVCSNDLGATFGSGIQLKAVTLEITDTGVTEGQATAVLSWLCDHIVNYRRLSGETGIIDDNKLSNRLGPGNFSIGQCK